MAPATRFLKIAGIDFTTRSYDCEVHEDFGLHAATQLGLPADQVYKTLLVQHDKQVVTAVIPVSCMLSLKEVAKAAKLKKVEMMKPQDAERLTGYKVGGISPFAQKKQLPTLLDSRAMQQETILVSGGRRGLSVGIKPQDFIQLLGATVAPIGE